MNPLQLIRRRRRRLPTPAAATDEENPPLQPLVCHHCRTAGQPFHIVHSPPESHRCLTIVLTCVRCRRETPMHAQLGKITIQRGNQ